MTRRFSLSLEGMHCAACAESVAKALESVKGVKKAIVNIATDRVLVEADERVDFRQLASAVENAGYRLTTHTITFASDIPLDDKAMQALLNSQGIISIETDMPKHPSLSQVVRLRYLDGVTSRYEVQKNLKALGYEVKIFEVETPGRQQVEEASAAWERGLVGLALSFIVMALTMFQPFAHQLWSGLTALALTTFVVLWVGVPFFQRAWKSALRLTATMDTLVSIGSLSAYAYSVWSLLSSHINPQLSPEHLYFDSAAFILSAISLGKGLEVRARATATASLRRLVQLLSSTARVIRNGSEQEVALEEVQVGDFGFGENGRTSSR
ncbi:MAG: cation transporter [Candidatus Fervidibacter sp.]|uniref:cation transporter n=1 Tax=Candidatus Fervidibacter sp. TaxID=3100871 RepID=UPI0040490979